MAYNFDQQLPRIGTYSCKWDQYGDPDIIAMSTADMDFRTADTIIDALTAVAQEGCFNYHMEPDSYYDTIIKWYQRRHNWEIKREWITNTPGIWASLHICLRAYTKPGDRVILQTPHFSPLNGVIARAGCHMVTNTMVLRDGRYEIDFDDFEKKVASQRPAVYICINLQNPTGRVFTKEELLELNRICRKYRVVMIADEVHSNVLYDGHIHYPAASISDEAKENTIVVTAASKAYNVMDLTHCILVIPDEELRRKYNEARTAYNYDFAVNAFGVAGLEAAFSEKTDPWLDALGAYLQDNLDYLVQYMEENIPRIKAIRPEGSYLVWLDCRDLGMSPEAMKEFFLKKARVGLTWGETYGKDGEGFERINIGCPRKTLEEGLRRIRDAVNAL